MRGTVLFQMNPMKSLPALTREGIKIILQIHTRLGVHNLPMFTYLFLTVCYGKSVFGTVKSLKMTTSMFSLLSLLSIMNACKTLEI